MAWLGGWLREIILVVLLASFVEMLLPSKSMERYARLVLSLLVLLTMLGPIISLLKGDAVSELSLAMAQQNEQGGIFAGPGQESDSLEKILADGLKMAEGRQKESLKLAAGEIAVQMKDQITSETGVQGVQVTVKLVMRESDNSGGEDQPAISSVDVTMSETTDTAQSGANDESSEAIAITPVEPIKVSIHEKESGSLETTQTAGEAPAHTASGPSAEVEAAAQEQVNTIKKLLVQKWGLAPDIIEVTPSIGGTSKL
ncbi:stage III sporulation protein AF [Paenibacillus sp. sgz500958]|uniref:stage III sporulation protein AF n=1 Tax=Paenibacillus sp. sgz500958 TaxID=3242475 RepID=UPI0036D3079E